MPDDIKIAVVVFELEVAVVRRKPAVAHRLNSHRMGFEADATRGLLAAITRVAIDIDRNPGRLSICAFAVLTAVDDRISSAQIRARLYAAAAPMTMATMPRLKAIWAAAIDASTDAQPLAVQA